MAIPATAAQRALLRGLGYADADHPALTREGASIEIDKRKGKPHLSIPEAPGDRPATARDLFIQIAAWLPADNIGPVVEAIKRARGVVAPGGP